MSMYFSLSVQFKRDKLYPIFAKDFYALLDEAAMKFQLGYWRFGEDSLEKTTGWNQWRLEEDSNFRFTEYHSYDCKQVTYKFSGYPKVRGFWMDNYPEDGELTHEIIIPESDALTEGYPVRFKEERIEKLLGLSKRIW